MKVIFSGLESSGKSLRIAEKVKELVLRNSKWLKITGVERKIYSNIKFSENFIDYALAKGINIIYWKNLDEIIVLQECDIIIDEVGNYFDSRMWTDLSLDARRWLTQGAKTGVEIYGTAQDFAQVDKSFRRLTTQLFHITKLLGSSRPSATKPPIKFIWGLCMVQELNPRNYSEENQKFDSSGLPSFFFIEKEYCNMFNTQQKIEKSNLPPFKHDERKCLHCDFKKIIHS